MSENGSVWRRLTVRRRLSVSKLKLMRGNVGRRPSVYDSLMSGSG
jgi:hypothetical protein